MRLHRRAILSTGLTGLLGLSVSRGSTGQDARQEALDLLIPLFQKLDVISFDFMVNSQGPGIGPYQGDFHKSGATEYGSVRHNQGHIRQHVHLVEGDIHKTITWGPAKNPAITIGRLDQVNVGYGLGDGMQLLDLRLPWCGNRFQTLLEIVKDPATVVKITRVPNAEDRILELAKDNCQATLTLSARHGFMPISSKGQRTLKSGQVSMEREVKEFEEVSQGVFVPVQIRTLSSVSTKELVSGNSPGVVTDTRITGVTLHQPIPKEKLDFPKSEGVVVYDYLNNQMGKYDAAGNLQVTGSKLPSENEYSPFVRINLDPTATKPRDLGKVILDKEKAQPTWQSSLGQAFRSLQEKTK